MRTLTLCLATALALTVAACEAEDGTGDPASVLEISSDKDDGLARTLVTNAAGGSKDYRIDCPRRSCDLEIHWNIPSHSTIELTTPWADAAPENRPVAYDMYDFFEDNVFNIDIFARNPDGSAGALIGHSDGFMAVASLGWSIELQALVFNAHGTDVGAEISAPGGSELLVRFTFKSALLAPIPAARNVWVDTAVSVRRR